MRRVITFVVMVVLLTSVLRYVEVTPEIDLSTPGAIQLAAFNGQLNGYMRTAFPEIQGEATKSRHQFEIEINSASLKISKDPENAADSSLTLTKRLDRASPVLYQQAASGAPIANVYVKFDSLPTQKASPVEVLQILLGNAVVTSHQLGVSNGTEETLTLGFEAIRVRYRYANSNGVVGTPVETCWNFAGNNTNCPEVPS